MSLRKFDRIENFDELNLFIQDLYSNISISDINPSDIRTIEPTTETLDKGRWAIVELSGSPSLYYLTLAGVLYKWTGTAV